MPPFAIIWWLRKNYNTLKTYWSAEAEIRSVTSGKTDQFLAEYVVRWAGICRITKSAVNQQLKKLCDEGKLQKYENDIYYLPKKSRLKTNVGVNADTVARYKYVSRGGKVDGFYSGNTFANQLGISTQVPNKVEIVSNNMAAKVREVPIWGILHHLRKPLNI